MVNDASQQFDENAPPKEIVMALGGSLVPGDELVWAALTPANKKDALERVRALRLWEQGGDGVTAAGVSASLGISRSQFYRMARNWESGEARSLRALGLGIGRNKQRPRKQRVNSAKARMELALKLVGSDPKDEIPVSELVRQLRNALGKDGISTPSDASLRSTIVESRRRRDIADTVGLDLAFDLCACSLRAENGLHTLAICLDRGTGLILGLALAEIETSLSSYRKVARNALARIEDTGNFAVPWSHRFERCELVIGFDTKDFRAWQSDVKAKLAQPDVKLTEHPKRFGQYIKQHIGISIGSVRILPTLTVSGHAAPTSVSQRQFSGDEALARLIIEAKTHNDKLLGRLSKPATPVPSLVKDFLADMASTGSSGPAG